VFGIVLVATLACPAQELKPEDVVEGAAASAKSYLRDTTELPLSVATTIQEFDAAGKLRRTRHDAHRFSIVQARPDEYKARTNVGAGTFVFHHGSMMDQVYTDMVAVVAGMLLRADIREHLDFRISRPGAHPEFRVGFHSPAACTDFVMKDRHVVLANWCGSGEYAVDPAGYALQHFSFEAAGSPMIDGKKLRGYRVEETFQSVTAPGVAKPFIVPKTITATYETEKGKTVLTSDFTLLPENPR
jgi:hypothetical protein